MNIANSAFDNPAGIPSDVVRSELIDGLTAAWTVPEKSVGTSHAFEFSGNGKEYFRIWIVNLCLTMATLGIYSAWAKVRRLQYFDQNTRLAGAVFNFHGNPVVMLRGRLIGVFFLFCYHYIYGFSKVGTIFIAAGLLIMLPLMLRGALRFRLRNTSYRGLRFDFQGSVAAAFAVYLPVILLFLLPGLVVILFPHHIRWIWVPVLLWPWLYVRMKRYQYGNVVYGQKTSVCKLGRHSFFMPYLITGFGLLAIAVVTGLLIALAVRQESRIFIDRLSDLTWVHVLALSGGLLVAHLTYLICGPGLQSHIWNRCWAASSMPGIRITSTLPLFAYVRLQARNVLLTILTLGLYRPFAVIAAYRFRLEHMNVWMSDFDLQALQAPEDSRQSTGDGSADLFGFDLSW